MKNWLVTFDKDRYRTLWITFAAIVLYFYSFYTHVSPRAWNFWVFIGVLFVLFVVNMTYALLRNTPGARHLAAGINMMILVGLYLPLLGFDFGFHFVHHR